jgi:eukaryotic-like serine/threonine-protein kinase
VDANTGLEKWKFETQSSVYSSPAIAEGMVYFGSGDRNLYALDMVTGQEAWRFKTGGPIYSSPSIVDGVIYFGSDDGCVYAVT